MAKKKTTKRASGQSKFSVEFADGETLEVQASDADFAERFARGQTGKSVTSVSEVVGGSAGDREPDPDEVA